MVDAMLGFSELATYEELASRAQSEGTAGLLDIVVAGMPDIASRQGDVLRLDYGEAYPSGEGSALSGVAELDLTALRITADGISGRAEVDMSQLLVDGDPPQLARTATTFRLEDRGGSLAGGIDIIGFDGPGKNDVATFIGYVDIDTAICEMYPTGGAITRREGDQLITITFGPDCDGAFVHETRHECQTGHWDYEFRYTDPRAPEAQEHIVSVTNAAIGNPVSDYVHGWGQAEFGEDCVASTPGEIIYHFELPSPAVGIAVGGRNRVGSIQDSASGEEGHGTMMIYGSADGTSWHVLAECIGGPGTGNWPCDITVLPHQLLGSRHIWLRYELCCAGWTTTLDSPCFLAVHCYYSSTNPYQETFVLGVDVSP